MNEIPQESPSFVGITGDVQGVLQRGGQVVIGLFTTPYLMEPLNRDAVLVRGWSLAELSVVPPATERV